MPEAKPADRGTFWLAVIGGRGFGHLLHGAEAGRGEDGRDLAVGYVQNGEPDGVLVDAGGDVVPREGRWGASTGDAACGALGFGYGATRYLGESSVYCGDAGGAAGCGCGAGFAVSGIDDFAGGVDAE